MIRAYTVRAQPFCAPFVQGILSPCGSRYSRGHG